MRRLATFLQPYLLGLFVRHFLGIFIENSENPKENLQNSNKFENPQDPEKAGVVSRLILHPPPPFIFGGMWHQQ